MIIRFVFNDQLSKDDTLELIQERHTIDHAGGQKHVNNLRRESFSDEIYFNALLF